MNSTKPKGTRSDGRRPGIIQHAPASSAYYSLATVEPKVRSIGASCFSNSVLSTEELIYVLDYPSCNFPVFLARRFEYWFCRVIRLIAGLKKATTAGDVSGKCPAQVGKIAVSWIPVRVVSTL